VPPDTAAAVSADLAKPKRKRPWPELAVAALLLIASIGPVAYDLYKAHGLMVPGRAMIGRDFLNCWAGARLALEGRLGEIWSPGYMAAVRALTGLPLGTHNFSYPPSLLLFIWPLGFLAYVPALILWLGATGAAYGFAARPYLARAGLPWWTAALVPAVFINIWAGHHGFILAALWLAAFASIERRPATAGLLIALLTLKPHMGVLIPLVLLLRRQWKAAAVAAAATLALVALSGLIFGWASWAAYFDWTARLQAEMLLRHKMVFFYFMPTAYVTALLATKSFAVALAAQILFGAAALVILVRAALSRMPWPELGLVTATATFLVLPYAFNYDMVVVGVAATILLFGQPLHWAGRIIALFALGTPILVMGANYEAIPLLPALLLAFLFVQARACSRPVENRASPAWQRSKQGHIASANG
jgi:hypothetical protein